MAAPPLTLVLGGARSGKSAFAEQLVMRLPGPWTYVATAEGRDAEMQARIEQHRLRRGAQWRTLDAPLQLASTIREARGPLLVDCLTVWLSNLMEREQALDKSFADLETALRARPTPVVLVSNEVGMGIVPDNALARRFRDAAGRLHQRVAAVADVAVLVVAGLPIYLKGAP